MCRMWVIHVIKTNTVIETGDTAPVSGVPGFLADSSVLQDALSIVLYDR